MTSAADKARLAARPVGPLVLFEVAREPFGLFVTVLGDPSVGIRCIHLDADGVVVQHSGRNEMLVTGGTTTTTAGSCAGY